MVTESIVVVVAGMRVLLMHLASNAQAFVGTISPGHSVACIELSAGRTHVAVAEKPMVWAGKACLRIKVFPLVPALAMLVSGDTDMMPGRTAVGDEATAGVEVHTRVLAAAYAQLGRSAAEPKVVTLESVRGAARSMSFSSDGEFLVAYAEQEGGGRPCAEADGGFDAAAFGGDLRAAMQVAAGGWDRVVVVWRWAGNRLVSLCRPSAKLSRVRVRPVPGDVPDCSPIRALLSRVVGRQAAHAAASSEAAETAAEASGGPPGPADAPALPHPTACLPADRVFISASGAGRLRSFRLQDDSTLKEAALLAGASSAREDAEFTDHAWVRAPQQMAAERAAAEAGAGAERSRAGAAAVAVAVGSAGSDSAAEAAAADAAALAELERDGAKALRRLGAGAAAWGFGHGPGGWGVQGRPLRHAWALALTADNSVLVIAPRGNSASAVALPTGRGPASDVRALPRLYEPRSVVQVAFPQLLRPLAGGPGRLPGAGRGGGLGGVQAARETGGGREEAPRADARAACLAATSQGFVVGGSSGFVALFEAVVEEQGRHDAAASASSGAGALETRPSGFRPVQCFLPGAPDAVSAVSAVPGDSAPLLLARPGAGPDSGLRLFPKWLAADSLDPRADPTEALQGHGAHSPGAAVRSLSQCLAQPIAATASADGTVRVWSLDQHRCEVAHEVPVGEDPLSVALHPSGHLLAVGFADKLRVYNVCLGMGQLVAWGEELLARVTAVAYSPNGGVLAAASGQAVLLFRALAMGGPVTLKGRGSKITGLSWSQDCSRLATCGEDGSVNVWDARTGLKLESLSLLCRGLGAQAVAVDRVEPREEEVAWAAAVQPALDAQAAAGSGGAAGAAGQAAGAGPRVGKGASSGAGSSGTAAVRAPSHERAALAPAADVVVVAAGASPEPATVGEGSGRDSPGSSSPRKRAADRLGASAMVLVQRGQAVKLRTAHAARSDSVLPDMAITLTCLCLHVAGGVLYAGTSAGTVRAYKWPLELRPETLLSSSSSASSSSSRRSARDSVVSGGSRALRDGSFAEPDFAELQLHAGPVTALQRSPEGAFLLTAGADGCMFALAIPRPVDVPSGEGGGVVTAMHWEPPPARLFNTAVTLVDAQGVQSLQREVVRLQRTCDEARQEREAKLALERRSGQQRLEEATAVAAKELARVRDALSESRREAAQAAQEGAETLRRLMAEHERQMAEMANDHEEKTTADNARFDNQQQAVEGIRQRAKRQLQEVEERSALALEQERARARAREQELQAQLEEVAAAARLHDAEAEAALRDTEAEYELELAERERAAEEVAEAERRLTAAAKEKASQQRKRQRAAESKKQAALRTSAETQRGFEGLQRTLQTREEVIASLNRKAAQDASKAELAAQEARGLESSVTQLQNQAFVLQHARDDMLQSHLPLARRVEALERAREEATAELVRAQKIVGRKEVEERELAARAQSMLARERAAKSAQARVEAELRSVLHDLEMLSLLGEDKAVAAAAMGIYRRWVKGERSTGSVAAAAVVDMAMRDMQSAALGRLPQAGAAVPGRLVSAGTVGGAATAGDAAAVAAAAALGPSAVVAGRAAGSIAASREAVRRSSVPVGEPAVATRTAGASRPSASVSMLMAREMRSQEAMLELKTQRDAVRRGAASLSRKIKITEEVAERAREAAVADNATLLGECNRLKRELEGSQAESRRLRLELRRAASATAKTATAAPGLRMVSQDTNLARSESKGAAAQSFSSTTGPVGVRRGRRTDTLGSRRTAAMLSGASMPNLPQPGRQNRGAASGPLTQNGRAALGANRGGGRALFSGAGGADAVAGSQLPGRTIEDMEAQIANARREAEETASRAVGLVAAVGRT